MGIGKILLLLAIGYLLYRLSQKVLRLPDRSTGDRPAARGGQGLAKGTAGGEVVDICPQCGSMMAPLPHRCR